MQFFCFLPLRYFCDTINLDNVTNITCIVCCCCFFVFSIHFSLFLTDIIIISRGKHIAWENENTHITIHEYKRKCVSFDEEIRA